MTRTNRLFRLVGETAREIGVLVTVFAPLESTFAERPLEPSLLNTIVVTSVTLIVCGILLGVRE